MDNTLTEAQLASLPKELQNQISQYLEKPEKKELFPLLAREYSTDNFQTKEIKELGNKIDLLIEANNELHRMITLKEKK